MLSEILIQNNQGDFVDFKPLARDDALNNSNEVIRPLPEQKGRGYFSSFAICDGLGIGICRCKFDEDYMARFTLKHSFFSFIFCIKGHSFLPCGFCPVSQVSVSPGRSYTGFFDERVAERRIKGPQEVISVAIHVSPDFLIKLFCPSHLRAAQSADPPENVFNSRRFYKDHIITSQMKITIYQILNNPHKGRVGNIYLESKALELIALRLEQVFQPGCSSDSPSLLDPGERDRILMARDLLVKKLSYPPSLRELARQAGMSHTQLNKGFRTVFGCTVFEYLRNERLAYARMLIEENPDDLTWIAYESGFCSSSHFAASFLKAYGIRPSEYRKSMASGSHRI
ncbi:MAG: AraC family transcriptional regulator [Desulfobacterales bacterium]|nr:AraC family transcriptional regulator [Desulfobacterales bacterium]